MRIPNHDRESVSEALEAALYCAAFQRLEEMEMKKLVSEIQASGEHPEAGERVQSRLRRRGRWVALKRALPRAARAAAAVIAAVSIGTGIALAASPAARQWAAGVLLSRVTEPDGFFGEMRSHMTDGVAVDGRLIVSEDLSTISVYESADAEPAVYEWREAGDRCVAALAADGDDVWAIYHHLDGDPGTVFDLDTAPKSCGVGRVQFSGDGTFDIEAASVQPASALFDGEGRALESWAVIGCVPQGDGLIFATRYSLRGTDGGFSFAPQHVRLFRWGLSDGKLSEYDLSGMTFDWDPEVFGGPGGAFLAAASDGAAATKICRVEGDSLIPACEVPYAGNVRPRAFAWREKDDALLYVQDGSAWLAPDMDPSRAVRVAVCGDIDGRGLLPDGATYAVVGGESVRLFDLSASVGEMNELVVDGDSVNWAVNEVFTAAHTDVAITSDAGYTPEALGRYVDLMLAGASRADVVTLYGENFERARDAGLIAPLTDPELLAEWEKLPAGLQAYLSRDGLPVAIPESLHAYPDVMFCPEVWPNVCGTFEDYPDTWLEYANWLAEFSHGDGTDKYVIEFDGSDEAQSDAPEQFRMYTLRSMADAFARCWRALGEDADFSRPEFTRCLDALEGVDWEALSYGEGRPVISFHMDYDPLFSEDDPEAGCRTLRIREDAPRLSRASGCFVFVPEASAKKASAQDYLKALVMENQQMDDGSLAEAAGYDFATDSAVLAARAGDAYTAESIRRYRERVGDVAFPVNPRRESLTAARDAVARHVAGESGREEMIEALGEVYKF